MIETIRGQTAMKFRPSFSDTPRTATFLKVMVGAAAVAGLFPVLSLPALIAAIVAIAWYVPGERRMRWPLPGPGVMLMGHDAKTGDAIYLDSDQARQHILVVGNREDARAAYFADLMHNAVKQGSGGILVTRDPERTMRRRIADICADADRSEDLLVLDFSRDERGLTTHTFNPFAITRGSTQMAMVAMKTAFAGTDHQQPSEENKKYAFVTALAGAVAWKQIEQGMKVTPQTIAAHSGLAEMVAMSHDGNIPEFVRKPIQNYLSTLPGYDQEREELQRMATVERHSEIQSRLAEVMNGLDTTYPGIFNTMTPDVRIDDVIAHRRILLVVLPAADEPHANAIGRMVVTSCRDMLGNILGSKMDADWETTENIRPYVSDRPFFVMLDDIPSYVTDGMASMAAQGRSLNISMVFGVRDIPSLMERKEAKSIIANTATKIFLHMDAETPGRRDNRIYDADTMNLERIGEKEGFMTLHDKCRRIRIDKFPRPEPTKQDIATLFSIAAQ